MVNKCFCGAVWRVNKRFGLPRTNFQKYHIKTCRYYKKPREDKKLMI